LGAGSEFFSFALADLAIDQGLAGSEITLFDLDWDKTQIMARLGQRFAQESGVGLAVRACADLADAVDGADFALSSIGGSGPSLGGVYGTAVHRADLLIPAKYGIYQLVGDTGGPAGMMMALRSIPTYLAICAEMERRCPEVVVLNHSNPMAPLCRAMLKHSGIRKVIGICHGVQNGIAQLAELMGVRPAELEVVWIGTNHYYWFTRIRMHGRDIYPEVTARAKAAKADAHGQMCAKLSEAYGYRLVYQDDAHAAEFYPFLTQADPCQLPYAFHQHAGEWYRDPAPEVGICPTPEEQLAARERGLVEYEESLRQRGLPGPPVATARGDGVASIIESIATARRKVHILNLPNRGAVPNLPDYAVLEVEGVTDSCGARAIHAGEAPMALKGLLEKRIAWQELVVDAAVAGDRNLALQALLTDEMSIRPELAEQMLDELLAASRELLPQFSQ
jgi:alpha-galactosidase